MRKASAAQDDAAGDVDVIAGGNEIADDVEDDGHGLARKNVTGEEDAGEKGEKSKLEGLGLGVGFAGDENAYGKRDEKIGERKERKNQYVAVNGNLKNEAHEGENQAELGETDGQIGKELAEKKAHGADRRDEQLFECAALFFTDDGESVRKVVTLRAGPPTEETEPSMRTRTWALMLWRMRSE